MILSPSINFLEAMAMEKNRLYEVSAAWMKACGKGDAAKTFYVKKAHPPVRGLSYVELIDPETGGTWSVIAEWRGRFLEG